MKSKADLTGMLKNIVISFSFIASTYVIQKAELYKLSKVFLSLTGFTSLPWRDESSFVYMLLLSVQYRLQLAVVLETGLGQGCSG